MNSIIILLRRSLVFILPMAVLLGPAECFSGGILHVFPPIFRDETFAVARPTVLLSKALITVSESFVEYRIDQTFFNNNDFPLDAIYLLPVHKDAEPPTEVRVNASVTPYDVVSPDNFFPTLRELTTSMKDPALLGLAGKRLIVVRSLHIGIRQQKSFRIHYRTPLHVENDQLELLLPLEGERYSLGPVGELDIQVRFKMSRPVRNVFSPSHHIAITREAPHRCLVASRIEQKRVREDFRLVTTFSNEDLDLRILVHRAKGAKGAFMALISPPILPPQVREPDKDVVFLLDTSGSMGKNWLGLAKRSVVFGLERLGPKDRFNVLSIGTRVQRLSERMLPATAENVMEASRFVNSAGGAGGTDLYNGLIESLEQFTTRKRPGIIILAGDGRGTVGTVNPETIAEDVRRYNRNRARLFVLALGNQADMALLDKLAMFNHGTCYHFAGSEDFPSAMNRFFSGVSPPQVSDISLEFQDMSPEELEADPVPDLFGQESLTIFGRYGDKEDISSRVKLRGKIRGRAGTLNRTIMFPSAEPGNSYVPALWAMRRMAHLLEKDWLKGPEPEVREQIANLAKEFGFKTPFPVTAPGSDRYPPAAHEDGSRLLWRYKTSNVVSDVESDEYRRVGAKTFHLDKTKWVDVEFRISMPFRTVEFLSEDYFGLLKEEPKLGPYLALGPEVIVVQDTGPVQITFNPQAH
jgi:Ca-activated chloride channel homolog